MTIGFISTVQGHQWPGSEYLWSGCAEQLMRGPHRVVIGASTHLQAAPVLEKLRSNGAAIFLVPPVSGRVSRIQQRIFNPFRHFSRQNVDLMVVSCGSAYDPVYQPAFGRFLLETDIPFIYVCHFNAETLWVDDGMRGTMSTLFEKARTTVFVSQENRRLTERQLGRAIPRSEIIVPPLCLNVAESLPWTQTPGDAPWRLACVARLEPRWKGQDVLFEVLSDGRWQQRNYILSLYGQGAEEGYLRDLSRFYGLENKVRFAGFAKPVDIWRDHHLQVLAARGEGGPMVITEGMICGRAAVTTRCGFTSDYILDGQNGFLADFATAGCFARKMEEAWERRAEWEVIGRTAHESIKARTADFDASARLLKVILNGKSGAN